MDLSQARENMVDSQVRSWEVTDPEVISIMRELPREMFVPNNHKNLAYMDEQIPLNATSSMLPPKIVGRILQAVMPLKDKQVLEIGTGSGYLSVLLSKLSAHVTTVEIDPDLHQKAQTCFKKLELNNIESICRDFSMPFNQEFDIIIFTGSVPILPEWVKNLVHVCGKIFAIVGTAPIMQARLFTNTPTWQAKSLFETYVDKLQNFDISPSFEF